MHILQEFAVDFSPPQTEMYGATGLDVGEQNLFAFLIDPSGWTEIAGQAFAPRLLRVEQRSRQAVAGRVDLLVPEGVPESHLGRRRGRRVFAEAHGEGA